MAANLIYLLSLWPLQPPLPIITSLENGVGAGHILWTSGCQEKNPSFQLEICKGSLIFLHHSHIHFLRKSYQSTVSRSAVVLNIGSLNTSFSFSILYTLTYVTLGPIGTSASILKGSPLRGKQDTLSLPRVVPWQDRWTASFGFQEEVDWLFLRAFWLSPAAWNLRLPPPSLSLCQWPPGTTFWSLPLTLFQTQQTRVWGYVFSVNPQVLNASFLPWVCNVITMGPFSSLLTFCLPP